MDGSARTVRAAVLAAFFLSGAAALGYEVIWTRALSLVLGSTTYALSTMLATFMGGLALGGAWGGRLADRGRRSLALLGACELGIGVLGLASVPVLFGLPSLYLIVYRQFHFNAGVFYSIQVAICALVMLAPTILMGMTFPLVTRALTRSLAEVGREVGTAYACNTAGAVAGSLLTGFVLLPRLGLTWAAVVAAATNLVIGATLLLLDKRSIRAVGAVLAIGLLAMAGVVQLEPRWTLVNFYSAFRHLDAPSQAAVDRMDHGHLELIEDREYPEGRLRAFRNRDGQLVLQVGGKLEGTTAEDLDNVLALAYLPAALHPDPRSMLIVGLGAGVTLGAAREVVPEVEVVEIHPGVVEAVRRYGPPGVLDGARVVVDDGRRHLLLTEERYDVIVSAPSYPSGAAVANLFTREQFRLGASRLAPGGIYCQAIPYYLLTNDDVSLVIRTFGTVFPHALLWKVPRSLDLLLIGSERDLGVDAEEIRRRVDAMAGLGRSLDLVLSRDEEEIAAVAGDRSIELNTDDRPLLEFRVARNLRVGDLSRLERQDPHR